MSKRLRIELAVLLVWLAVYAVVMWRPLQAPTKKDYDRIQRGMTRAEVEHLLGPPGDYRSWATMVEFRPLNPPPALQLDRWATDAGVIGVRYVDEVVVEKNFYEDFVGAGVFQSIIRDTMYRRPIGALASRTRTVGCDPPAPGWFVHIS